MLSKNGRSCAASAAALIPSCAVNCEGADHLTGPCQYHLRRRSLLGRT